MKARCIALPSSHIIINLQKKKKNSLMQRIEKILKPFAT